ncbi:F-box domain, Skp2-like protein [Cordyceps fumosorosea ARSEF 2679]|uniref:F-box domain, Skp2-like protein n=1 Tax=Cordyceps fumosorosea (strain ARSEF 2679) TaxID=1081104 RepID=A0A162MVQ3_CORFA|nr:F-box domain, Skp2-like protein [Cordyceps fumosorosea ARSEF 2679]OAA71289.1 F-box domain, Skp2-like protein [Cordyceps fumosorosea ARSEF 2679]
MDSQINELLEYFPGMPPRVVWIRPPAKRNNWLLMPSEIILHVFEELITVEDMWAMACTCRRFWAVFRTHGPLILEMVLEDDTHPWVRNVMHATFNVLAYDSAHWTYEQLRHLDSHVPREPLSGLASPELVRRFVTRARQIHAMAHVILERCMAELWTLEDRLRPGDPLDECPELAWYLDREANPVEETRAVMGLWLCELHFVLTDAARDPRQAWVARMFQSAPLANRGVFSFFRRTWLGTLLTLWHGMMSARHAPGELDRMLLLNGDAPLPARMCVLRLPRGSLDKGFRCEAELPNYSTWDVRAMFAMSEMSRAMRARPLMNLFFESLRAVAPRRDDPLHALPLQAYIKFGVFHWDHDKLDSISLLPDGEVSREELFKYWRSFLRPELIVAYAARQAAAKATYWANVELMVARGEPVPEPQDDAVYRLHTEDPPTEGEGEDEAEPDDMEEEEEEEEEEGF